ncbi:MAG TPA: alpha/beta hydrolase-fold protein, partial [Planctomycetota bacterium]|nr:alpha/beta hydrolase-fold protein [Planctomycetota bacterium]
MSRESTSWRSERLGRELKLVRWGVVGTPVLLFPTAAGDAEECERFLMIDALAPLMESQRIKVYSVDSIGTQAILDDELSREHAARVQNRFDEAVYREVVPAIRADCRDDGIELIVAGASLGAFNALAAITRHPDVFRAAICMSGTYDLTRWMTRSSQDWFYSSPLDFLPGLGEGALLEELRKRFVLLTHGTGRWESPKESWNVADLLGSKRVPNRVDEWG